MRPRRWLTEPTCVRWGCGDAKLIWLQKGEMRQTQNGFLIAHIAGWYCPACAGSYGGTKEAA